MVLKRKTNTQTAKGVYEHASGAYTSHNEANTSWILRASASAKEAAYVRQADDEDIVPPNGEWPCHSGRGQRYVKAA